MAEVKRVDPTGAKPASVTKVNPDTEQPKIETEEEKAAREAQEEKEFQELLEKENAEVAAKAAVQIQPVIQAPIVTQPLIVMPEKAPIAYSGKSMRVQFQFPRRINGKLYKPGQHLCPVEFSKLSFFQALEARGDLVVLANR
jgi:hypothetical protein